MGSYYPTADPGHNELDRFKCYDIMGIVNTSQIKIPFSKTNKVLQRFGVIFPSLVQGVVEIWNTSIESEPKFHAEWSKLQLIFMKSVRYHGQSEIGKKTVHVFRLSQKENQFKFIWLSDRNFWIRPIGITDPYFKNEVPHWPNIVRCDMGEGVLRCSNGSRFGSYWKNQLKTNLHSMDIFYPYMYTDFEKLYKTMFATLNEVPTGFFRNMKWDDSILFDE